LKREKHNKKNKIKSFLYLSLSEIEKMDRILNGEDPNSSSIVLAIHEPIYTPSS
jgi:hypothetical protein